MLPLIIAASFVWVTSCILLPGKTLVASADIDRPGYAVWIDGVIQFGGEPGNPAGLKCPGKSEIMIEKVEVSPSVYKVKIFCGTLTS